MTVSAPPVLEFPAMLHGLTGAVLRKVRAQGQRWAREFLETGALSPPRQMLPVPPGELLEMFSGAVFDARLLPRWRVHLFEDMFSSLSEGVPRAERPRLEEAFESFCLSTPWGALYHAVSPSPPRSAARMAQRFAALLRFWDVLQGPRYAHPLLDSHLTLEELMALIYRDTCEAWCPGGPTSVREHLSQTAERMARATREDCQRAVLRMIPFVLRLNTHLKHREVLDAPDFAPERLAALSPGDWEDVSGADRYAVNGVLHAWDRALGR